MGSDITNEIGHVLRQVRRSQGLTLRGAAERTDGVFSPTSIAGYERGERSISVERLFMLAHAYDVQPARLVGEIGRRIDRLPRALIDLSAVERLGNPEGTLVAEFAHEVAALRHTAMGPTIVLRGGDLEVLAAASGQRQREFLGRIAPALAEQEH